MPLTPEGERTKTHQGAALTRSHTEADNQLLWHGASPSQRSAPPPLHSEKPLKSLKPLLWLLDMDSWTPRPDSRSAPRSAESLRCSGINRKSRDLLWDRFGAKKQRCRKFDSIGFTAFLKIFYMNANWIILRLCVFLIERLICNFWNKKSPWFDDVVTQRGIMGVVVFCNISCLS